MSMVDMLCQLTAEMFQLMNNELHLLLKSEHRGF